MIVIDPSVFSCSNEPSTPSVLAPQQDSELDLGRAPDQEEDQNLAQELTSQFYEGENSTSEFILDESIFNRPPNTSVSAFVSAPRQDSGRDLERASAQEVDRDVAQAFTQQDEELVGLDDSDLANDDETVNFAEMLGWKRPPKPSKRSNQPQPKHSSDS